MDFIYAVILGLVEGITEFLPISSTGHLILASDILKLPDSNFWKSFEVAIQLGAILAVVILYWRRILSNSVLIKKIIVAFIPTAVIGLVAYPFVKKVLLGNTQVVLWALFLGGVAIWAIEKWRKPSAQASDLNSMSYKQAFGIGLAQSISIIPGVSRAAATILGGMFAGLDRKSIVEFSFMLAIPTMAAATGLDLIKTAGEFSPSDFAVLGVGFITAFITAWFAVKWLIKYIQTNNFIAFGIYRIALALIFWLVLF